MEFLTNSLQNNSSLKCKPNGNVSISAQTYHYKRPNINLCHNHCYNSFQNK